MTARRAGLSLAELGVAALILGLAMLPVINLFSASGRQARQTSDHALAVTVSEKVAEELRLANWENVYSPEDVLADPTLARDRPVVDAGSSFFAGLEDVVPPWGLITTEDPGITSAATALYRELKTFRVRLGARPRSLPTTGAALDIALDVKWIDFKRSDQSIDLPLTLGFYGTWGSVPRVVEDRTAADSKICSSFYPTIVGRTLPDAVAEAGGDLSTVRGLGDMVLIVNGLWETEVDYRAELARMETAIASASSERERAHLTLAEARLYERRAAQLLVALMYLAGPVRDLAQGYEVAQLGSPTPPGASYMPATVKMPHVRHSFDWTQNQSAQRYAKAYDDPLGRQLPPRHRIRAFVKLLELVKLQTLTAGPEDVAYIRSILEGFRSSMAGRNPNFVSLATHELAGASSIVTLRAGYRQKGRFMDWGTFREWAFKASRRILSGGTTGAPPGPGPGRVEPRKAEIR